MILQVLDLVAKVSILLGMYMLHREYKKLKNMLQDMSIDIKLYDQMKIIQKVQNRQKDIPQNKVGTWKK